MTRFARSIWLLTGAFRLVAARVAANDLPSSTPTPSSTPKPASKAKPKPKTKPSSTPTPGEGIREVGEHAYEIPLAELQAARDNLEGVAQQARVVPAFRDGECQGLQLFAVKPGSFLEKLGLQDGDVLQAVNGKSLKNPDGSLEAYADLRAARHIELDLLRGGKPLRKVYDVR